MLCSSFNLFTLTTSIGGIIIGNNTYATFADFTNHIDKSHHNRIMQDRWYIAQFGLADFLRHELKSYDGTEA